MHKSFASDPVFVDKKFTDHWKLNKSKVQCALLQSSAGAKCNPSVTIQIITVEALE